MPLVYDDEPGSWAGMSEGWPTIYCLDYEDGKRYHAMCVKLNFPYGSYVLVGDKMRLETYELKNELQEAMRG